MNKSKLILAIYERFEYRNLKKSTGTCTVATDILATVQSNFTEPEYGKDISLYTYISLNLLSSCIFWLTTMALPETRGSAVGWGTALQVGKSRVRFPMLLLEFFIDIFLPATLWPWGWLSPKQKWVPGIFAGGKCGRCVGLTTLQH